MSNVLDLAFRHPLSYQNLLVKGSSKWGPANVWRSGFRLSGQNLLLGIIFGVIFHKYALNLIKIWIIIQKMLEKHRTFRELLKLLRELFRLNISSVENLIKEGGAAEASDFLFFPEIFLKPLYISQKTSRVCPPPPTPRDGLIILTSE